MRAKARQRKALELVAAALARGATPSQALGAVMHTVAGREVAALVAWTQQGIETGAPLSVLLAAPGWRADAGLVRSLQAGEEAGALAPAMRAWVELNASPERAERGPASLMLAYLLVLFGASLGTITLTSRVPWAEAGLTLSKLAPALVGFALAAVGAVALVVRPALVARVVEALPLMRRAARERTCASVETALAGLLRMSVPLGVALRIAARTLPGASAVAGSLKGAAEAIDRGAVPAQASAQGGAVGVALSRVLLAAEGGGELAAALEADAAERTARAEQASATARYTYYALAMVVAAVVVGVTLAGVYGQVMDPAEMMRDYP